MKVTAQSQSLSMGFPQGIFSLFGGLDSDIEAKTSEFGISRFACKIHDH